MKAVVIYESIFGNTRKIAEAIGKGLGERYEVSLFEVGQADYKVLDGVDLLVVGGPTHIGSLSRPASRQAAVEEMKKMALDCQPVSGKIGLREWLSLLPDTKSGSAAAFDTRMPKKGFIPVSIASRRMASKLKKHGYRLAGKPEGFVVTETSGPLRDGELERAVQWGRALAVAIDGYHLY